MQVFCFVLVLIVFVEAIGIHIHNFVHRSLKKMYWTVHVNGGPMRVNHAAVLVGHHIYSFGGYCSGEDYRVPRPIDVHIMNTADLRWKLFLPPGGSHQEAPFQRYGHTAVAHNECVYLWGGRNDEAACNRLYCFDTRTLEWSHIKIAGYVPSSRDGHSACVINDCMYIFGGYEDDIEQFSQEVHKLDLRTFTWSYVKTMGAPPSYRDFHSGTAVGGQMFVFGGRGDSSAPFHSSHEIYCDRLVVLDTTDGRWTRPVTTGQPPTGRRSHSAFVYQGHIYVFGGFNSVSDKHFNDLHRLDYRTLHWEQVLPLGQPPSPRRRQSCIVHGDRMFLFGGTSPVLESDQPVIAEDEEDSKLLDHDDLHILEFDPSLVVLCLQVVIQHKLDTSFLPEVLKKEMQIMTRKNSIQRIPTSA